MQYDTVTQVWYPVDANVPYFTLTDSDMRTVIRRYLMSQPQTSNATIARELLVNPELVRHLSY